MSEVRCFMLDGLDEAELGFRRYRSTRDAQSDLCIGGHGYHNAERVWERRADPPRADGRAMGSLASVSSERLVREYYGIEPDDPRWPETCDACDYRFIEADERQISVQHLWKRRDTGEVLSLRDAPAGAMWYADWYHEKGPDGHALCVRVPMPDGVSPMLGDWIIDSTATGGGKWTRSGEPPIVTATPSILIGKPERYHGFLTDGVLRSV